MGLGIAFSIERPDGGLPVVEVDGGGPVARAGGNVGDVWLSIDGSRVLDVINGWTSGARVRTPDVAFMVQIERGGVRMMLAVIESPGAIEDDDDAGLADETDESSRSFESAESTLPPVTPRDRLRMHLGKLPLDPDIEALLKRDSGPTKDPYRADHWAKDYDPTASRTDVERFWKDTERIWK
jgi:hypothetical protein